MSAGNPDEFFAAAGGVRGERGGVDVHDDPCADARSARRRAGVGVRLNRSQWLLVVSWTGFVCVVVMCGG